MIKLILFYVPLENILFHSEYQDATIPSEERCILYLYMSFMAFEQGYVFIVPYRLWLGIFSACYPKDLPI